MKKVGFLIDTSGMPELITRKNVRILPVKVSVTRKGVTKEYDDFTQISKNEIIKAMRDDCDIKTAQTPYGVIEENIIDMLKTYDRVYCLVISKTLSGLYNSYCQIKTKLDEVIDKDRLVVVDTNALGIDINLMIEAIQQWEDEGKTLDQVLANVKTFTKKRCGGVVINNLKTLIKGGRITGIKSVIAKALNLHLLIKWNKGVLSYQDKAIRLSDALNKTIDYIQEDLNFKKNGIKRLTFYDGLYSKEESKKWIKYTLQQLNLPEDYPYEVTSLPGIVLIYLGPDFFGFYIETN